MHRHIWASALFLVALAGCGQQPATPPVGPPPAAPFEASGLNDVKFTAAVTKYEEHTPYAFLEASGKPRLMGARVTESYFMYYEAGTYAGWKHVFLGRDGGLYLAAVEDWRKHPEKGLALSDDFHRIGTYERRAAYAVGDQLKIALAPGVELRRVYENEIVKVYKHLEIRLDALPKPTKRPSLLAAKDVAPRKR